MEKKSKMQDVSFRNVDELLDYLPKEELKITELLRHIVFECAPYIKEGLSYNIPYYKQHLGVCFIWPGSIAWDKKTREGVRFGFTKGYLLNDESNYLDKGTRKQMYWRDFHKVTDIDAELLKSYLYEALIIDEEEFLRKKQNRQKKK